MLIGLVLIYSSSFRFSCLVYLHSAWPSTYCIDSFSTVSDIYSITNWCDTCILLCMEFIICCLSTRNFIVIQRPHSISTGIGCDNYNDRILHSLQNNKFQQYAIQFCFLVWLPSWLLDLRFDSLFSASYWHIKGKRNIFPQTTTVSQPASFWRRGKGIRGVK